MQHEGREGLRVSLQLHTGKPYPDRVEIHTVDIIHMTNRNILLLGELTYISTQKHTQNYIHTYTCIKLWSQVVLSQRQVLWYQDGKKKIYIKKT